MRAKSRHPRLIPARAGKTPGSSRARSGRGAHPRACGENFPTDCITVSVSGSSPRVRGKRRARERGPGWGRLIPARAGKTVRRWASGTATRAHPRACGENLLLLDMTIISMGSSPRVRGKLDEDPRDPKGRGLIPARAEKTSGRAGTSPGAPAHPRACGENILDKHTGWHAEGSSPRVRGKHPEGHGEGPAVRLIPARAGKTGRGPPCSGAAPAHPRACGENAPRWQRMHQPGGLIPACAGKTPARLNGGRNAGAHPRVCGENCRRARARRPRRGSSPRVRGKPPHYCGRARFSRLIPACAGKTDVLALTCRLLPAHPRVCGENTWMAPTPWSRTGSSPRVRGKRDLGAPLRVGGGLIPACAGKTGSRAGRRPRRPAHPRVCEENYFCGKRPDDHSGSSACAGKTICSPRRARGRPAHPRVCGENLLRGVRAHRDDGSSPRVRGKP